MVSKIIVPKEISGAENNASVFVVKALESMKKSGGELFFEKGEYHFYTEGTHVGEFVTSNSGSGVKRVAFPFVDAGNITVDGNGSVFVFHEGVFPFLMYRAENITVKNFTMDTFLLPYCEFDVVSKDENGFAIRIDKNVTPYRIENGNVVFLREDKILTTAERKLSLHAVAFHKVMYLFAGDSTASKVNLPAPIMLTDAEDRGDTVYFRYRDDNPSKCAYEVGEAMTINLEEARERHCFFAGYSDGVTIENVTIRRGAGMGVLGMVTDNITVKGLKTDRAYHGNLFSLTADAMHFINCSGKLQILDCDINAFMDDVCNIHGTYNIVESVTDDGIEVRYGHEAHARQRQYKKGDILHIINNETLEKVCEAEFESLDVISDDGMKMLLKLKNITDKKSIRQGFFVENPGRMPEVLVKGNKLGMYPHFRISGAKKMVCEDNLLYNFQTAFYICDLAVYWYESGRVRDLAIRNNVFDNTKKGDFGPFITVSVSGHNHENAPLIHDGIKIENNKFYGVKSKALSACGVKNLKLTGNTVITDGKESEVPEEMLFVADKVNLTV